MSVQASDAVAGLRVLVAGWWSFELMGASAGDLLARDVAVSWLERAGFASHLAGSERFPGVDWRAVDPGDYTHLMFVCGPFGNGPPLTEMLERFASARLIAVDVSLLQQLADWDPFDLLLERDSERTSRPDIAIAARQPLVPVLARVFVHDQKEYPDRLHAVAHAALDALLVRSGAAVVSVDTCLDPPNTTGLHTAAEIESVLARVDVVVTTRLHGLVLALKNGVPALAVDPVAGGAKVARQAAVLGWPHSVLADRLSDDQLDDMLAVCLTDDARALARRCAEAARAAVSGVGEDLLRHLHGT